jgi:2-haloacid dehalogenase
VTSSNIKALTFDVFGTVVDWRSSIIHDGSRLNREKALNIDWAEFADAWRSLYQPSLSRVRNSDRPWANLDQLHRESLETLTHQFGLDSFDQTELDHLNHVWHRLQPWPDTVEGLLRLKRKFILATLSNGNVALLVNMARHAGLPWDVILGAETARCYKPLPQAYLVTAELLGLAPSKCMMVAAHNDDLEAARDCGFSTAFVHRPTEYGPGQTKDLEPTLDWDVVADNLVDLAAKLGC